MAFLTVTTVLFSGKQAKNTTEVTTTVSSRLKSKEATVSRS
jgi:hypothetical protein